MNATLPRKPTPIEIVRATSKQLGISVERIMGPRRSKSTVRARQIAMYITRQECELSYPVIGRFFERDHATVMHSVRIVGDAPAGGMLGADVERVRQSVYAHVVGIARLVAHSDCGGCNELRASVEALRAQLADAYRLLDRAS